MKMHIAALCAAAAFSLALAGCSHREDASAPEMEAEAPTPVNPQYKQMQVSTKDLRAEYEKAWRRGAAIDGGGGKHFLDAGCSPSSPIASPSVKYDPFRRGASPATARAGRSRFLDAVPVGAIKDYSYYELSRWQRFCDGGRGMDSLDWKFIRNWKKHPFPSEMLGSCRAPSDRTIRRHGVRF